jgi:hypothetical protein
MEVLQCSYAKAVFEAYKNEILSFVSKKYSLTAKENIKSDTVSYICDNIPPVIPCNPPGDQYYTHTTYTKTNPYLPGAKNVQNNGAILYSEQSIILDFTGRQDKNIIVPITFYYSGASPSNAVVTFSDPNAPSNYITGYLSYSENNPVDTPFFIPVFDLTAIKILPNQSTTIWVTVPSSGLINVRFMMGYAFNISNKPSRVTKISYTCGSPYYAYNAGLHAYSGWDALPANNPKLNTWLYSLTAISSWTVGTKVFADRQMSQPAFPYYYGINDKVYHKNFNFCVFTF